MPRAILFINVPALLVWVYFFSKYAFIFIKLADNGICLKNVFGLFQYLPLSIPI